MFFIYFLYKRCSAKSIDKFTVELLPTVPSSIFHTNRIYMMWVQECFNPFLFIKNKWLYISSEGFSTLEKTSWYVFRGQCCHSSRVGQPSVDNNGNLAPFCFNFLGQVWQPSVDNNGEPNGHYYLQRAVTPDQITRQNSLQRARVP